MIGLGQPEIVTFEEPHVVRGRAAPNVYQRRAMGLLAWWRDEMDRIAYCCLDPGETDAALATLVDPTIVTMFTPPQTPLFWTYYHPAIATGFEQFVANGGITPWVPADAGELKAMRRAVVVSAASRRWAMVQLERSWRERPTLEALGTVWLGPDPQEIRDRIAAAYDRKHGGGLRGLGQADPEADQRVARAERSLSWHQARPWVYGGVGVAALIGVVWLAMRRKR